MLNAVEATPRLYKGDITTVEKLLEKGFMGALPIQPIKRTARYGQMLPPSFVITKLQKTMWGTYQMHYYAPNIGRSYREVPMDMVLNVLTGTHGRRLQNEWRSVCTEKLGSLGRRLVCTVGTDPEIFAVDANGEIVPAWTYLPGKEAPLNYKHYFKTGSAYWDGFQAEFTTMGTDTCLLWLSDNIQGGLKTIYEAASKVGAKLTIDTVLPVNPDILQNEKLEHVQFGCAPSYNVYELKGNIEDGRDVPYRFAGGHLHFGISHNKSRDHIEKYVKALDMVLGVASVSLLGELDNPIRRKFYGLPGEYRMPDHGFEYRTLSNAWLCHPLAMNMVFDMARSVCGLAEEGLLGGWQGSEAETLEIIINNDISKAREVLDRNKAMFRQICKVITGPYYQAEEHLDIAFKVWRSGIDTGVKDPKDIVGNWNLNGQWVTHGDGKGKNWHKAYEYIVKGEKM